MIQKKLHVSLHPVFDIVCNEIGNYMVGTGWLDKLSKFKYLFHHPPRKHFCCYGCLNNVYVVCDLNQFKIGFGQKER